MSDNTRRISSELRRITRREAYDKLAEQKPTAAQYVDAGCKLAASFARDRGPTEIGLGSDIVAVFSGLMNATGGDPCKTGCAWYNGGKCKTFRELRVVPGAKLAAKVRSRGVDLGKTNAELAAELSRARREEVTKRQVAKMRRDGTLDKALKEIRRR